MAWEGQAALVTGGFRGIGRGVARALSAKGVHVHLLGLPEEQDRGEQTAADIKEAGGQASVRTGDVTVKSDCGRVVDEIQHTSGRLDILVNVAGICPFRDFFDIPEDEFDRVMAVNAKGIFLMSQAAGRLMARTGRGRIVNVTSISGEKVTNPQQTAYCTSKAAANMLTRCMAVSLAPYKITVNAVLPGTVPTDINAHILADSGITDGIIDATPLKALGEPKDIADAVLYFASPDANWVTGSLLVVDGGFML